MAKRSLLGELLVQQRLVTPAQLQEALEGQLIFGGRLGTNLIELRYLSVDALANALALHHSCPNAPAERLDAVPPEVIDRVPRDLCEKHTLFPFSLERDTLLHVAMANPTDLRALDEASFALGLQLRAWSVPELRLYFLLERYYGLVRAPRYLRLDAELGGVSEGTEEAAVAATPPAAVASVGAPSAPATAESSPSSGTPQGELVMLDEVDRQAWQEPPDFDVDIDISQPDLGALAGDDEASAASNALSATQVCNSLAQIDDARMISELLVQTDFERVAMCLLFRLRGDFATGLCARGSSLSDDQIEHLVVPLALPSPFEKAVERKDLICAVPQEDSLCQMVTTFTRVKQGSHAAIVPVAIGGRLIHLLYLQAREGKFSEEEIGDLRRVAAHATAAYTRLIRQRKRSTTQVEPTA